MKKVLLFLFLINLSLFAQTYTESTNKLYHAIKANNPKAISNALSWGYNLNSIFFEVYDESPFGNGIELMAVNLTPLFYAINCTNIGAIDTLLKLGADIERLTYIYSPYGNIIVLDDYNTDSVNMTPLMYAAYCAPDEIVSFLIKKGAKVNSKNEEGKTALMYGSSKVLINAGADVNAKDNKGTTALMYAAYNGAKVSVDLLIKNKANVNTKDNNGTTALMYACMYDYYGSYTGNLSIVKSLIRAGANIDEIDNRGNNALLHAIHTYSNKALDFSLLEFGMPEPEKEYENDSYSAGILELIKLLINNGANVNIRNKEGETPLSLSKEFPKLTKLLRDSGAYLQ